MIVVRAENRPCLCRRKIDLYKLVPVMDEHSEPFAFSHPLAQQNTGETVYPVIQCSIVLRKLFRDQSDLLGKFAGVSYSTSPTLILC